MATPNFAVAAKGLLSINATLLNCLIFEYDESAVLEDITYTTPGAFTFAVKIPGYASGRGSIEFIYDTANMPQLSPYSLTAGALLTVIAYPEGTKPYSFQAYAGRFRFRSGPQAIAGGTSVHCTVEYETTGIITRPPS